MPSRPRILIVDDNRGASELFTLYLESRGYALAHAYCGLTGLALAKATRPDLVILNLMMPGMNGLAVLRELRSDPKTAALRVIMTSGHPPIAELAPAAGAQDFIVYPVKFAELGEKVERVLRS